MNYELFVSLRYLRAKRKQTFISVISFISISGITLGVAALIVVLAVMTGFHDGVRQQILGNIPHILIQKFGDNLTEPGAVVESETEEINHHRRMLVQMLFHEGNHLCPICEASGNCELQAMAYRLGISQPTRFPYLQPVRPVDAAHQDEPVGDERV